MIGQTVSHYKILEELGGGGMGVVYKAEDTKLKRTVALKFLSPDLTRDRNAKTRFIHEAQAASALQHNNICTIHEIDETPAGRLFIAMDCYEGESLKERIAKGPLPVEEVIDIACQIAEGLAKAHEAGMVHRDIKPANIMITNDGVVKIVDFGLAKLAGQTKVTKTGTTVGTVAYMSPEQVMGKDIDQRSDIFSFGAVLYEMLVGKVPFKGDHEAAVLYGVMHNDPEPMSKYRMDVPKNLARIIETALHKEPEGRYHNASELAAVLDRWREEIPTPGHALDRTSWNRRLSRRRMATVFVLAVVLAIVAVIGLNVSNLRYRMLALVGLGDRTVIRSIAVLPFQDLGSDPETQYLSDEIPASIINNLARLPNLRVIPRVSAFRIKAQQENLEVISSTLDVRAVLTGQITVHRDKLIVRTELVDVQEDRQLWGDRYSGTLDDILSVEDEIVTEISNALRLRLTGEEQSRLLVSYTENPEAHRLYLKGRYYWNRRMEEDFYKAIECFEQAIVKSPDYAMAYAALAETYALFVDYGIMQAQDAYPKAVESARKAIEIDETLSEPYTAMGYVLTFGDRDWTGAERQYKRAIEYNPNYANAHHWYAMLLYILGRDKEALTEINRALEIDPLSLIMMTTKADVHYYARRYETGIDEARKAIEMDPNFMPAVFSLWRNYLQAQMYTEALSILEDVEFEALPSLALTYAMAGMDMEAREALGRLTISQQEEELATPTQLAMIHAALGDKDRAFKSLEDAFERRDFGLPFIGVDPRYDPLRDDPRFMDVIRRLGLKSAR